MMDEKHHKHRDIYNSLEPRMKEMDFIKSGAQMKTKLKHLKEMYFKCKRNNNVSASRAIFSFYNAMEQLFGGRSSVQAIADIGINSSASNIQGTNNLFIKFDCLLFIYIYNNNNNNVCIDIILELLR